MMDPAEAVATCEQAIRQLVRHVVSSTEGLTLEALAGEKAISRWRERADTEAKKRQPRGVVVTSSELLDYSDLFALIELLHKSWEKFKLALGKEKEVLALLKRLDDMRNTIAHGRELLPFEKELAAGIAGDIRNRVTIYMSSRDEDDDFYPRIESLTDDFGSAADCERTVIHSRATLQTNITLNVGDRVRFVCHGTDPQGRTLLWRLSTRSLGRTGLTAQGNDVEFEWVVATTDVSKSTYVTIELAADGTAYHRWRTHDGQVAVRYEVKPPIEP